MLCVHVEEVETVIDTVETVADIVEKVAEQVEKVADNIGDHLPEGRLKDALEFVEDIAEDTADGARLTGEFIDKVIYFYFFLFFELLYLTPLDFFYHI